MKVGIVRAGEYVYRLECWGYGYVAAILCLEGRDDSAEAGRYAEERTIG
jgi:hypothetical protein